MNGSKLLWLACILFSASGFAAENTNNTPEAALQHCDSLHGVGDEASQACYDELIKQYPQSIEAISSRSRSAMSKDYATIEKLSTQRLKTPNLTMEQKARLYNALAYAQSRLGKYPDAIISAETGLAINTGVSNETRALLYMKSYFAFSSLNNYKEAEADLEKGLAIDTGVSNETRAELYANLSSVQLELHKYKEAVASIEKGLAIKGGFSKKLRAWLYINLAYAYGKQGNISEALINSKEAVSLDAEAKESVHKDLKQTYDAHCTPKPSKENIKPCAEVEAYLKTLNIKSE